MTIRSTLFSLTALAAMGAGLAATAQDLPYPVQARQGQFTLMQLNGGVLVGMARGDRDYDADLAQVAADNLVTLSRIDQSLHWPEGTDSFALDGTRALPEIWDNLPDMIEKWEAFGAAAEGLAAEAGNGLDPMRAALGPLGASCSDCHDTYRQSE